MDVRHARIPMRDGVELAATLYLPAGGGSPRVPALLEYLPYRKDDAMLARDYDLYGYMARHGYAGARVDIRGTGQSGGELPDGEYSEQEQDDAEEVIAWLAAQPWCTGTVGMWGISWGGFNAIQVALRRPPALKAIIAVDASDDLFHDDVHYIDGLLHLDEYALMIDHLNALPPAPGYPLDEPTLRGRFDRQPWLVTWLGQARDGPYWRRASLRPGYSRLALPAFLIGGWYDGYRDSIPRMAAAAPAPVKVLIGPWNHTFPHNAVPGPAIEWRAEAVRWWDHWLKGLDNQVMAEPPVTVYVRHWHPPGSGLTELPGRWRSEDALPPARTEQQAWHCRADRTLAPGAGGAGSPAGRGAPAGGDSAGELQLRYVPSAGIEAGHWWGELAADQRGADAFSLTFDSAPLEQDLEILGFPVVHIRGSADATPLHWFARLCDVAPDGTVTLVTGAGRAGPADPLRDPPAPAGPGWLPLSLHVTSWVFPRGHRVRLAISNAMWPMIWPTPRPATATVRLGEDGTRLMLPVVPGEPRPEPRFAAPAPAGHPPGVTGWGEMLPVGWTLARDGNGRSAAWWRGSSGSEFPWGRVTDEEYLRYEVADSAPAAASARGEARTEIHAGGRVIVFTSVLSLASDETGLDYRFRRELRCQGALVREREWQRRFPRDGH